MIREARLDEAELIAAEFWYPLASAMGRYSALNELADDALETATDGFEGLLGRDDRYDLLLETDGTPVGYVSVEVGERPTREHGRYATIVDLYVKEGHRREGHATALVERAETVAETEDCDFLRVSAEWGNKPARALYEERGYEPKQVTYTKRVE